MNISVEERKNNNSVIINVLNIKYVMPTSQFGLITYITNDPDLPDYKNVRRKYWVVILL